MDSQLYYDNRVIVGVADKALMDEFGATKEDFEGCVEQLRVTRGAMVAVLIYYKSDDISKISLRSLSDDYNVSKIAEYFGGGGHVRAAGCDVKADIKKTKEMVLEQLEKIML